MLKCISMILKARPNTCGWMYEWNAILKNCVTVRKQHMDHRMHLVTQNVDIVTCSNSTIQSNYRNSGISRYCCPIHNRFASMFYSWNQAFRIIGFLGCLPKNKPSLNWGTMWGTTHLTILHISNHQMFKFFDHHTIFFSFWHCFQ